MTGQVRRGTTHPSQKYETEMELTLYKEYRDIVSQFSYVVETERRFYLANSVDVAARNADGEIYFDFLTRNETHTTELKLPSRDLLNPMRESVAAFATAARSGSSTLRSPER